MFKFNEKYNINIDYNVFAYIKELEKSPSLTTDDLHFCLLAMVGGVAISNPYTPMIYTTIDNIIMAMAQDVNVKVKPKVRTGLMDGFNALRKYGVIKMSEPFTGDKKQVVSMDLKNIEHMITNENGDIVTHIQIGREELSAIIKGSNVPHHLITIMLNYCSRFNINAYTNFSEGKWYKDMSLHNVDVASYKRLSTWISRDTARETWYNEFGETIERANKWDVSNTYFSNYCNELVNLGIFDRLISNEQGTNLSYYFRPMYKECVEWAIELLDKQQMYMNKQQPKEEPKQPIEPIQPKEEPKPFGIPRGGEREASNCIPLTEIEASHTSEANKKAHEKARARDWNVNTIEQTETNGQPIEFDLTDLYIQPKCSKRVNRDKRW